MKVIEIRDEGLVCHVPLEAVTNNRADHYADYDDTSREQEFAYTMEDNWEALDWFANNMNFSDVASVAKLAETPVKSEPGINADLRVIEID